MAKINGKYEQPWTDDLLKQINSEDSITKRHHLISRYLCQREKQVEKIIANIEDDNIDLTLVIEQLWEDLQLAHKQVLQTMDRIDFYADYYKLDKKLVMTEKEKIREYLIGMANAACCNKQTAKDIKKIIIPHIDSMQEEPATSLWHDASERPVASKTKIVLYTNGKWDIFKAYETKDDYDNYWAGVNQALEEKGVLVKRWAYVEDSLKL